MGVQQERNMYVAPNQLKLLKSLILVVYSTAIYVSA